MSKKIFIDCGAHNGCSVRKFRKIKSDSAEYSIHSFEPNKEMFLRLAKEENINLYNCAVSTNDGQMNYYVHDNDSYACTTFKQKGEMINCGSPKKGKVYKNTVEAINLSLFINKNFDLDDYIILKLDVEGEEYNIIPHLLKNETFKFINELWIEWHSRWIGNSENLDKEYEQEIKKYGTTIDNTWDAAGF